MELVPACVVGNVRELVVEAQDMVAEEDPGGAISAVRHGQLAHKCWPIGQRMWEQQCVGESIVLPSHEAKVHRLSNFVAVARYIVSASPPETEYPVGLACGQQKDIAPPQ